MAIDTGVYAATRQYLDWARTHPPGTRRYESPEGVRRGDLMTRAIRIATDPGVDYIATVPGGLALMVTGAPPTWPADFAIVCLDLAFDLGDSAVIRMRDAVVAALTDAGHPFLPLSLRAAREVTPSRFGEVEPVDRDGLQCVFRFHGRYYISGYDSNESPPLYFLARLPGAVATFAEGIEALKPPSVKLAEAQGVKVLRQGDMFAIATGYLTKDLEAMGAVFSTEVHRGTVAVPHITFRSREGFRIIQGDQSVMTRRRGLYGTAHTATELAYLPDGTMFARGAIRHCPREVLGEDRAPDHKDLPLPGRTWYLVARNTVPIAGRG